MQRATAEGLLESFEKKQIFATAYLFREILVSTGPLSGYLQSVNVDLGKALAMIDSCLSRLQRLRNDPDEKLKFARMSVIKLNGRNHASDVKERWTVRLLAISQRRHPFLSGNGIHSMLLWIPS